MLTQAGTPFQLRAGRLLPCGAALMARFQVVFRQTLTMRASKTLYSFAEGILYNQGIASRHWFS